MYSVAYLTFLKKGTRKFANYICGLIGAIRVYSKFSSGDPDTGKTAGSWFGACVFLIVAATVLRSFFL